MSHSRPGVLATRAVNQYRRRDVVAYLPLRYYLEAVAARKDSWAERAAVNIVINRNSQPYAALDHFKEIDDGGKVVTRQIHVPGPNEILAETVLLANCAAHDRERLSIERDYVFSYRLVRGSDRSGVYENYVTGLKERQNAVSRCCEAYPDGVVRFLDIKRFYPSIGLKCAYNAWNDATTQSGLPKRMIDLGAKLIADHSSTSSPDDTVALLTGPMFTHYLANLVLRSIDTEMHARTGGRYFRYVDDIVLVGDRTEVDDEERRLTDLLGELGLMLHENESHKSLSISTKEWLTGRDDFGQSNDSISWMTLIGDLKRHLLMHPEDHSDLESALSEYDLRIPLYDYQNATSEASFVQRVNSLGRRKWFREKVRRTTSRNIVDQALYLREKYYREFGQHLSEFDHATPFLRKRLIPKLRYRAGRLMYLGNAAMLAECAQKAELAKELAFHSTVMNAVSSGDIDRVLEYGTNAAQAVAQPLKASGKTAYRTSPVLSDAQQNSLAVFLLNGVQVADGANDLTTPNQLLKMATTGSNPVLMKEGKPFMREFACLHGSSEKSRHETVLHTAFDIDESPVWDALGQFGSSSASL